MDKYNGNSWTKEQVQAELGDDYCLESVYGKHEPDPQTVTVQYDGGAVYFDVSCAKCGRSGCAGKFDADEVTW